MLTQYLFQDVREKKLKSSGVFLSGASHYDLLMNFSFDLHQNLSVLDDVDVIKFEDPDNFIVNSSQNELTVGNYLIGSLQGNWSLQKHSASALHIDENGSHLHGGVAYLRRISAINPHDDESVRIETSLPEENILPKGSVSINFNNTKARVSRRTDAEALQAVRAERRLLAGGEDDDDITSFFRGKQNIRHLDVFKDNVGVCDSQCDENAYRWNSDYDYIGENIETFPNSELCRHCFEIVKE